MGKNVNKKPPVVLDDVIATDTTETVDIGATSGATVHIDDNAIVYVKSNVFGELIYIDRKTGEKVEWDKCGAVQRLSFASLRSMKASDIKFFQNQWVIIIGFADENSEKYTPADIYQALYITQYYKNLIEPSDYEAVCSWKPDEIKANVALMSSEAKANLAVALNTYVEKGILDSLKAIKTFEEVLGCDLKMPE